MLNSVNDKSPLILQGIVKPERTIYLPDNHSLRGEITYIEEDIRQIKTEQATQNTDIALNRANIAILSNSVGTLQDGKVDEIYDPNIVYGTNDTGATVGIEYSANSDPLSIIQRDENGRSQIESPLNDKDIANKEFVENLVDSISVNIQANTAKIENVTNILLDNEQVAIAEVSQAFTTRQTADGENIIDNQNVFPKLIKGSTVKSANLLEIDAPTKTVISNGITFTANDGGTITLNGQISTTNNAAFRLTEIITLKAGTYTSNSFLNNYIYLVFVPENGSTIEFRYTKTHTIAENLTGHWRLLVNKDYQETLSNYIVTPMLNDGETALPFRPYFSGLKNAYLQSIKSTGRNLLKIDPPEKTKTYRGVTFSANDDGTVTLNGQVVTTGNSLYAITKTVTLKAGQYWAGTNNAGNIFLIFRTADTDIDFANSSRTLSKDYTGQWYLVISKKFQQQLSNYKAEPMMFFGSTEKPFEPYVEDTFNLPETLGLDEWDSYNPQTGELTRGTRTIVFDGTENWVVSDATYNTYKFNIYPNVAYKSKVIHSNAPFGIRASGGNASTGYSILEIYDNTFASAEELKAYLASNPLTAAYLQDETVTTLSIDKKYYKAWNSGSETQVQGETDNSADGAICTITNDYFVKVGGATNEQTE